MTTAKSVGGGCHTATTVSTISSGDDSTIADNNSNTPIVTHHCICCYHRIGTNNRNYNEQTNAKTIGEEESADGSKTGQEGIKRANNNDGDHVNNRKEYIVVAANTAAGLE